MFVYSPALGAIPLDLGAVLELHMSVNQPSIAAEGLDAQDANAYFVSGHGPDGLSAYVYLHMVTSQKALVYEWDAPIEKSEYPDIQTAAMQFTESMGFMMDDLQFRRLPPEERDRVAADLPIFKPIVPKTEAPPAPEASQFELLELDPSAPPPRDESIFLLPVVSEPPSTQAGYEPAPAAASEAPPSEPAESPLEDKTFKVFLRLLTSV